MGKELTLSVHQLVDFLLRTGDIDNRVFNRSTMTEGSKIHSSYQSSQGSAYNSEYSLSHKFVINGVHIKLEGRADGVFQNKNGDYTIDEIKTTIQDLEEFKQNNLSWHLGQAKCYAFMLAKEKDLTFIDVRLTYIKQGQNKDKMVCNYSFSALELEQFVLSLIEDYLSFYNLIFKHLMERKKSADELTFPFDLYRSGQRELAKNVYKNNVDGGLLFCEAPTGIGKTVSTLFPSIKYLKEDEESKIFYLTAKSSGKDAAFKAAELLKIKGLNIYDIVITAKEKICFCKDKACNPDECPFASQYYNKIQYVLQSSLIYYSTFDYSLICQIAKENQICPFELQLDLASFCDLIICDYNYVFDPLTYMKRFLDEDSSHLICLVDEAHNLVDRSRDMYSAAISNLQLDELRKLYRHERNVKLKNQFAKLNKMFEEFANFEDGNFKIDGFSDNVFKTITRFIDFYTEFSKENSKLVKKELTDYYLDFLKFSKILDIYDDNYITFIKKHGNIIYLHIFCLNPSSFLASTMNELKATTLFSATLSPIDYYIDTLGGENGRTPSLKLQSPFNKNNLQILVAPKVSIKYKNREASYQIVREYILNFVKDKIGNYFIYSPSYEYMEKLINDFDLSSYNVFVQSKEMTEEDKTSFLNNFKNSPIKTTLGFLVLGGSFSEGIDLVDDRLIGAIIIGIGLPKINFESDEIAAYFVSKDKPGRDYAYVNPGINKVMQAVGRVIRSEKDRGSVLLIDERYYHKQFRNLFSYQWSNYQVVLTPEDVSKKQQKFFKD